MNTAPYGHNGIFKTLDEVVLFHVNPIPFFAKFEYSENDYYNYGRVLSSRSSILSHIELFKKDEIEDLIAFLETL